MASQRPTDQRLPPGDPRALLSATNIDRRNCRRVVPMEVLGLGLSRTGTASLRQALIDLGYSDCYHFAAVLNENPRDAEMWVEAYEAKYEGKGKEYSKSDFDQLLGHCRAITDKPCINFAPELLQAYPEAKVILSVRGSPEQWYKSMQGTLIPYKEGFVDKPSTLFGRIMRYFQPAPTALNRLVELIVKYDDTYNGSEGIDWVIRYENHNKAMMSLVPKENLLIYNVKQGWGPLCEFLGKPVPDWEFPRVNDTNIFQENMAAVGQMMAHAATMNILKSLGVVAATGAAIGIYIARKRLI